MEYLGQHIEAIVILGIFILSITGGLVVWENGRIHGRIDKVARELDDHVKEGTKVHGSLERIETKIDLHMNNGKSHS